MRVSRLFVARRFVVRRFAVVIALLGTPAVAVATTATSASAAPFTYTSVSVSHRGACALTPDGVVVCWGDNPDRYVMADRPAGAVPTPTRIALPNGQKWKSVNVGDAYSNCGLSESNRAWCWGSHHIGSFLTPTSRIPVEVEFARDVQLLEVQSGASTACATTLSRELWCWGDANFIGDGNIDPVRIPVRVPLPDNGAVASFNMGIHGICVITSNHNMYCWGDNSEGQLGLGYSRQYPYSFSWTPVLVPAPTGEVWASASVALGRICALTLSGNGYCAGDNYNGAFGDGTYNDNMRFSKMVVPGNEKVTAIEGGWYHTCISTESGTLWCAGRGDYGELGTGTTMGGRTWRTPAVPAEVRFSSFSAGIAGTCGLDTTGRVWCWGGLNWGSQGTGRVNASLYPELIAPVGSPSVVSTTAESIEAESARITGRVNPNGYATSVAVEIATSSTFSDVTRRTVAVSLPNDSYVSGAFSLSLVDLAPRSTYFLRVVASNSLGTVVGDPITITTLGNEPAVGTVSAEEITGNEAQLATWVHPHRLVASSRIEYSTDAAFRQGVFIAWLPDTHGNSPVSHRHRINNLAPNTEYFARVVATNRLGTVTGDVTSFSTVGSRPLVESIETASTSSSLSISVEVNTGLSRGEVFVEYSTSASFTNAQRTSAQPFSSAGPISHQFSVGDLQPRTNYWIRVTATNQVGSSTKTVTHRTRGGAPVANITSVSPDTRSALVTVSFDSTGLATQVVALVSAHADLSDATEYFVAHDSSDSLQNASIRLTQLLPRTTNYVAIRATNIAGTTYSPTSKFTTLAELGVLINDGNSDTRSTTVSLAITSAPGAIAYRVSNSATFRQAKVFLPTSPITWELLAADEESVERTVFVQVYFNDRVETYSDSITLLTEVDIPDTEAPIIESVSVSRSSVTAQTRATTTTSQPKFTVTTRDLRSGVTRIEVRASGRTTITKVDPSRRGVHSVKLPRGAKSSVQIRVRDAAGNYSKWKSVKVR